MATKTKGKGILRIDDPGKHGVGWYARVTFMGQTFAKYFADGAHGGSRKAYEKALNWRDDTEKAIGKPRTNRMFAAPGARNLSGIQGIYVQNGKYVAAWTPKRGQTRRKFFSINKYGEEEAMRKAINFRRARERELYGRAVANPSDAKSHPGAKARGRKRPVRKTKRRRSRAGTAALRRGARGSGRR